MHAGVYDERFFDEREPGSARSAEVIVPILIELLNPRSVVDVGCGTGSWLAVFSARGVERILGIDGDWIDTESLRFPPDRFLASDIAAPLDIDERFDLVVSLEVGEHLPANASETFVDTLVSLGPAVLFSAAIPFQGGTSHVNEQWPDFWIDLFRARGYAVADCIRGRVWNDPSVEYWYAQNTFMFGEPKLVERLPRIPTPTSLVHPRLLQAIMQSRQPSVRGLLRDAPRALKNSLRARFR